MRLTVNLLIASLLFLFSSCEKTSTPSNFFLEVETLMPQRPDSALYLLEHVEHIENLSRKDKAYYYLLLTEAQDKNYVEHSTDSLIAIATDYFEETDEVMRKAKAWYYRGRIEHNLMRPLKAQEYYLNALRDEVDIKDYALLGRIYNSIGMLYNYQSVYEKMLPYLKKAYDCFLCINDSIGQTYVLRDIARAYVVMNRPDSALIFYERALPFMKITSTVTISSELGRLYLEKGMYEKAYAAIQAAFARTEDEELRCPVYLTLGEYYLRVNILDSADYYLKKSLASSSLYTRAGAFKYLYESSRSRKEWERAVAYNDRYETLRDSIEQITDTESIRNIESFYNYQELNRTLSQHEITLVRKEKEQYLYIILICVILLVFSMLYVRWKKMKTISLKREEELEWSIELQRQRNKAQKEENERQITLLKEEIAKIKTEKEQELKIVSLELEKQRLEICNSSIDNAESKFILSLTILQKSPICNKFRDKGLLKVKSEDWNMLEKILNDTYNEFTSRLKQFCPSISDVELKACMLTKIDLSASQITKILNYNSSVLRPRIYKKLLGKDGSVSEFVDFILKF